MSNGCCSPSLVWINSEKLSGEPDTGPLKMVCPGSLRWVFSVLYWAFQIKCIFNHQLITVILMGYTLWILNPPNNALRLYLIQKNMINVKRSSPCYVSHECGFAVMWLLSQMLVGFYVFISTSAYQALCALLCQNGPLMFPDAISVPLRSAFSY